MTVAAVVRAGLLLCAACRIYAQVTTPAFEVASVKLTSHGRNAEGLSISDIKVASPGRLVATNASLQECIEWAYQVKRYQVAGPDWLNSDEASYDIEAKAPPETDRARIRQMLQTLLAERLHLKLHRESRILPVYELVAAKKGPKLEQPKPGASSGFLSEGGRDAVRIKSDKATMTDLANRLSLDLDRPVLDKTLLTGFYAIRMKWAREGEGLSVFGAIEEELGLKLQPAKSPIEVLLIDHAERVPSDN